MGFKISLRSIQIHKPKGSRPKAYELLKSLGRYIKSRAKRSYLVNA